MTSITEPAIIFAIMFALIKIIELLIKKISKNSSVLLDNERNMLKELHKLHMAKDINGVPLWYVPRSWAANQDKLLDKLAQISVSQEKISYVLDSLANHLSKLNK